MGDELDLTGNGGVLKRILREAPTDAIVPPNGPTLVDVHCKAVLPGTDVVRGTSEEDNEAYSFRIGTGFVIKGLEIAVKTKKVGEIATIACKPDYAHGEGLPPVIPPNATLTFEVELVTCQPQISASSGVAARPQEFEELDEAAGDEIAKKREAARDEVAKKREEAKKIKREEVVHGEYDPTLDGGVLKKIIKKPEADDAIDATPHSPVDARDEIAKQREAARDETAKKREEAREEAKKRKREEEVVHGEYDLTLDGGVLKKIIKKAEADAIDATPFSVVDVLYNGFVVKLETGQVLDFTFGDDTVLEDDTILGGNAISTFQMGWGYMMTGWDIALRTMKVGDIATITCEPNYAYGKEGRLPEIPPNATVISTLKLVACRPLQSLTPSQSKKITKEYDAKRAEKKRVEAAAAAAAEAAAAAAAAAWKEKKAAAARNAKGKRTSKKVSVFNSMFKCRPMYKL